MCRGMGRAQRDEEDVVKWRGARMQKERIAQSGWCQRVWRHSGQEWLPMGAGRSTEWDGS